MMYGIILAEIIYYKVLRPKKLDLQYNRLMLWILAMVGGWLPDMDALTGVFANIFLNAYPWNIGLFSLYHRYFSHSLGFLIVSIVVMVVLSLNFKKQIPPLQKHNQILESNPMGQVPLERHLINVIGFLLIIVGFMIYNDYTKYFAYFYLLAVMGFFGYTFLKTKTPMYGIVFFGAQILHHFCDFFQCIWNPLGPWAPEIFIGLGVYCGGVQNFAQNYIQIIIFDITPHIIVILFIIKWSRSYREYKSKLENKK